LVHVKNEKGITVSDVLKAVKNVYFVNMEGEHFWEGMRLRGSYKDVPVYEAIFGTPEFFP
jgi:hypothetical protein